MADYIVKTTSGDVRGYERDGRIDFLGIPYAEAPVGELRLKRSVPKTPWKGVFDAKEYGDSPVQYNHGQVIGSEDCLTVNVQRPLTGEKLPVFVWIYGGGYNTGESSDEMYRGEAFVRDGILFFSFNYRTNILGFYDFTTYPGCEWVDSNCGLSDQILALNWIRENVEAFGGDPDRITIGGESAGGASVTNMLVVPGVKGCFNQAIIESGLPNCVMTHEVARQNVDLFLEGMHWTPEELAEHLKKDDPHMFLPGHEYVQARHQYKNPGMFLPCPVIDDLLPERPIDALRKGAAEGIRLIIGTNKHEGTMFVHPENTGFPNNWTMVTEMVEKNGNTDTLPVLISHYHKQEEPFISFATDWAFEMPAVKVASAQSKWSSDVWMYRYELVTKTGIETGWKASHAFELPFVFEKPDHPFSHFELDGEPSDLFEKMCRNIHGDWVRFMKTGDPNADWERFSEEAQNVRIFDRETRTEILDRSEMMNAWGDYRFYEK
ncbi:MAG: carboxylesterase/lipase family protein [Lachnospiraceae bacterium]|nr:carboxylesterase/lipase family protein [Lachnospiraceae bacterium]